ncbi:hypothetical protein LguiA_000189 [Lonicera macranthoides]
MSITKISTKMVIQTETYPGFGYQQQSYTTVHDGSYVSPPNRNYQFSGVQVVPTPYTANPCLIPQAAYPQQPSGGWYNPNRLQGNTGWQSSAPGGWNSTGTDNYSHGPNGQMLAFTHDYDHYGYGGYQGAHVPSKIERCSQGCVRLFLGHSSMGGRVRCPCHS